MWTKEWGQVNPRTHNLYLYVQNDPLNNIDPSGHVLQMGTSGNQPATLWGRCPLCNDNYRNVPRNRTHCARCTRPGICGRCNSGRNFPANLVTCDRCGRRRPLQGSGSSRQPTPNPPRTNLPQGLLKAEAAFKRGAFKNSNTFPVRRGLVRIEQRGHRVVIPFHNSFHDRWLSRVASEALSFAGGAGAIRALREAGVRITAAIRLAVATAANAGTSGIQVVTRNSSFRLRVYVRYVHMVDGRRVYTPGRRTVLVCGRADRGLNAPYITIGRSDNSREHQRAANRHMENHVIPRVARNEARRVTNEHRATVFGWSPARRALAGL